MCSSFVSGKKTLFPYYEQGFYDIAMNVGEFYVITLESDLDFDALLIWCSADISGISGQLNLT